MALPHRRISQFPGVLVVIDVDHGAEWFAPVLAQRRLRVKTRPKRIRLSRMSRGCCGHHSARGSRGRDDEVPAIRSFAFAHGDASAVALLQAGLDLFNSRTFARPKMNLCLVHAKRAMIVLPTLP